MSDTIEFFKRYTRQSRSPWADVSRVVMMFQPETKQGIYLHLGSDGFNGVSISKALQAKMPKQLQKQYIESTDIDIVLHLFCDEITEYCNKHVSTEAFKSIFLVTQSSFFNSYTAANWEESYKRFIAN